MGFIAEAGYYGRIALPIHLPPAKGGGAHPEQPMEPLEVLVLCRKIIIWLAVTLSEANLQGVCRATGAENYRHPHGNPTAL